MDITYTINHNDQFNSLEIIFDGKPSEDVREILKKMRFRWHGGKKLWYGYADEETVRAALEGKTADQAAAQPSAGKRSSAKKVGTPQNRIRILYNGIKVDGELHRAFYSIQPGYISISARDYGKLPRGFFPVENDTDVYTDYFDSDRARIREDHPFYRFFMYAAAKDNARSSRRYIGVLEKRLETVADYRKDYYRQEIEAHRARIAEFEQMKDPGQPTQEDLDRIDEMKQAAENAQKKAEHEEELRRREWAQKRQNRGKRLILEEMNKHPIRESEPVVLINWSEHSAFYGWDDDTLAMSVAAAEIILGTIDAENHADPEFGGYDKTSFTISGTYDDGEEFTYQGRYDLGDGEGGMIRHIRSLGEWELTHDQFGHEKETPDQTNGRIEFADYLLRFTA